MGNEEEIRERVKKIYDAEPLERIPLLPMLSALEMEQLYQLRIPTWDGNVISKSVRDTLFEKGLIARWNGWQFVTLYGFAVLDVLGQIQGDRQDKLR